MRLASLPFVAAACLAIAACGSESDACVEMGARVCAKACACNGGTACRFLQPDGLSTATKTEVACNQFWEDACQRPEVLRIDTAKCGADADKAECVVNDNPLDGRAMAAKLPETCAEPKP